MKLLELFAISSGCLALAGCQKAAPPTPAPVNMLEIGDTVAVTTDAAANTLTLTASGQTPVVIPHYFTGANGKTYLDYNGLVSAVDFNAIHYTVTPDSGTGSASVFYTTTAKGGLNGIQISRDGPATLPTSGTASFTGGYYGTFVRTVNPALPALVGAMDAEIRGTAQMTATFGASPTIQGSITSRNSTNAGASVDVTFASTSLTTDGSFSGTASGGSLAGTTTSNGAYQGYLVGSGTNEAVGGLTIDHILGPTQFIETGVFYGQ